MTHSLTIPRDFPESAELGALPTLPIAKLETAVEWMRFCPECESEQRFIADRVCAHGLIGACSRCGDERITPFTRTTWEAS